MGFGVLGIAAIGATAMHNAKARQVISHRTIRISCSDGRVFNFKTNASDAQVEQALGPTFAAYAAEVQRQSSAAASTPEPVAPPVIGIADELTKLAALREAGVLSSDEFDAQKAKLLGT
jgi:hypothetical protein